jgi:hypothetical protein
MGRDWRRVGTGEGAAAVGGVPEHALRARRDGSGLPVLTSPDALALATPTHSSATSARLQREYFLELLQQYLHH